MPYMKFDLHCHTREGSPDGKVSVFEYAKILKEKGFDGMLITDHDSYRAARKWQESKDKQIPGFCVLQGIEYDTVDHGHFIVIMPEGVSPKLFEARGMRLKSLIQITHFFGGIIGPSHPYGAKFLSIMRSKESKYKKYLSQFDFIEVFNTSEYISDNEKALKLAKSWDLPCTGGSDSHKTDTVGEAYSIIDAEIKTTNDLIEAVLNKKIIRVGGSQRYKRKHPILTNAFPLGFLFQFYNIFLTIISTPIRVFRKVQISQYMRRHKPGKPLYQLKENKSEAASEQRYG